jgi:hypothetical protein
MWRILSNVVKLKYILLTAEFSKRMERRKDEEYAASRLEMNDRQGIQKERLAMGLSKKMTKRVFSIPCTGQMRQHSKHDAHGGSDR